MRSDGRVCQSPGRIFAPSSPRLLRGVTIVIPEVAPGPFGTSISYEVWLYSGFPLSFRMVGGPLVAHGIEATMSVPPSAGDGDLVQGYWFPPDERKRSDMWRPQRDFLLLLNADYIALSFVFVCLDCAHEKQTFRAGITP